MKYLYYFYVEMCLLFSGIKEKNFFLHYEVASSVFLHIDVPSISGSCPVTNCLLQSFIC